LLFDETVTYGTSQSDCDIMLLM